MYIQFTVVFRKGDLFSTFLSKRLYFCIWEIKISSFLLSKQKRCVRMHFWYRKIPGRWRVSWWGEASRNPLCGLSPTFLYGPVNFKRTPACTQTLFHFYFRSFGKRRRARSSYFLHPHPYPLALAVNKSPRFLFFLSRALDGLWKENSSLRGSRFKRKGKGVLGARQTLRARKEEGSEGNACQETIVFAIPPTNYVCKNNANCEWLAIK